jgi:hypothetical protein
MSDWKPTYGVSDQGAYNAGVHGTPNSTYDIARAQEETNRLSLQSATQPAQSSYAGSQSYSYPPTSSSTYFPDSPSHSDSSVSPARVLILCILAVAIGGLGVAFGDPVAKALLSAGERGAEMWDTVERSLKTTIPLHTATYEEIEPRAVKLAERPTAQIYLERKVEPSSDFLTMNQRQQEGVQAAWLRYTRNPQSFDALPDDRRDFVFDTFESYLSFVSRHMSMHYSVSAEHDLRDLRARRLALASAPSSAAPPAQP